MNAAGTDSPERYSGMLADYRSILTSQTFRSEKRDPALIDQHRRLLEVLTSMDGLSIALFDLAEGRYCFLRTVFRKYFAMDDNAPLENGLEFFFHAIHPEDTERYLEWSIKVFRFLLSLPVDERKRYRSLCDFRIRTAEGSIIRMSQQNTVLELDGDGNIWLVLTSIEPSKIRDTLLPLRRSLRHKESGAYAVFPDSDRTILTNLTDRQAEILGLIARGYNSLDIADLLSLSVHTVNTHRRSILDKLNVENSSEAVQYAVSQGLI